MKTLNDIETIIRKRKPELQATFHVREIGVFGSFVRGEATRRSDVDILVDIEPEYITYDNYADLLEFLEGKLRRKVDLVMRDALREELKPYVLREVVYV
jgi:predicted nucleotidyltransferase